MASDRSGAEHQRDPDSTPIERALHALRHGRAPSAPELDADEQQLVDDVVPWLDALREAAEQTASESQPASEPPTSDPPIRADDPVALMLGLVPDPNVVVDGRKLALARKRAKLDLAQFLNRLRARGWDVTTHQGLQWELGQTPLAPALITAIADELAVDDGALLAATTSRSEHDDLFDDARIRAFLADWSAETGVEPDVLRQRTSSTLAGAAHRNRTGGSVDALLDVLRTLQAIPDFLDQP